METQKTLTADFTGLSQEKAELLHKLIVTLAEMLNLAVYVTVMPEELPPSRRITAQDELATEI